MISDEDIAKNRGPERMLHCDMALPSFDSLVLKHIQPGRCRENMTLVFPSFQLPANISVINS